jgi:hypothetical protein
MFNFLRKCQTVFQYVWTILHSHQWCVSVEISPYPLQHLFSLYVYVCFDYSHPSGCEVVSHCSLICISLLANDTEHLFMYLQAIYISTLQNCLFGFFVLFNWVTSLLIILNFNISLYFLDTSCPFCSKSSSKLY